MTTSLQTHTARKDCLPISEEGTVRPQHPAGGAGQSSSQHSTRKEARRGDSNQIKINVRRDLRFINIPLLIMPPPWCWEVCEAVRVYDNDSWFS